MAERLAPILLADRPGPWRDALAHALAREHLAVDVTDDGREILRVLVEHNAGPRMVIVGSDLAHLSGHDALHRSKTTLNAAAAKQQLIVLVTDVRSDIELLDIMRSRGVAAFLYRDDPMDLTLDRLRSTGLRDRREAVRYPVSAIAVLETESTSIRGTLENLSSTGAQFTVNRRRMDAELAYGDRVNASFAVGPVSVRCEAHVRQLGMRKAMLADRVVVGLEFLADDAETRASIESAVRLVVLRLAIEGRLKGDAEELDA